jgi:hypothetical protein
MANLSKAVCHGESDKCRFGNPPQESNSQRLGIRLSGGNLALKSAARPPDDLLARIKAHKKNIIAILKQEAAVTAPPEPDDAGIEERIGMAADSVPEPYLDAWTQLQVQKPFAASDAGWRQVIDDAGRFLDQWGNMAAELQWTAGDLFDVPRLDGACGLVWWLKGRTVSALGPEHAYVGEPAYDRVTRREWVNPYSRPVRPVSLSPILERQRDHATAFPWPPHEGNR